MRRTRLVSWIVMFATVALVSISAGAARAEGAPLGNGNGSGGAGLGVGAAAFITGMAGVEVAYDQPAWHIEGLLGLDSRDVNAAGTATQTEFAFGVRAWYHLHRGSNADFSVGGGVGFDHFSLSNNGGSGTETFFEPGAEARVFLTPNFALFGALGLTLAFGDSVTPVNTGFGLAGQTNAFFGFTYFFR